MRYYYFSAVLFRMETHHEYLLFIAGSAKVMSTTERITDVALVDTIGKFAENQIQ